MSNKARGSSKEKKLLERIFSVSTPIRFPEWGLYFSYFRQNLPMCLRLILNLKSSCLSLLSAKTKSLFACLSVSIYMSSGICRVRKGAVCPGIRVTSGLWAIWQGCWVLNLYPLKELYPLLTTELFLQPSKGFHFKQDFLSSGMAFIGARHDSLQLMITLLYLYCTLWALWLRLPSFFLLWVPLMLDGAWMLLNKWIETLSEKLFLISIYRHGLLFKNKCPCSLLKKKKTVSRNRGQTPSLYIQ